MILCYSINNNKEGTEVTHYIYDGVSSVSEKEDIIKIFFREKKHEELKQELTFLKSTPEIYNMCLRNDRFELLKRLI